MAAESVTLVLGSSMPSFTLQDVQGRTVSSEDYAGLPVVVIFLCGHCPYVQAVEERYTKLARDYMSRGIAFVGICSNDYSRYPEDSPQALRKRAQEKNYPFPILIDESQQVARAFGAQCTPEFFFYDKSHKLYYHGRLDDNWKDPKAVSRHELRNALEAYLRQEPPPQPQYPALGCSIKWKM